MTALPPAVYGTSEVDKAAIRDLVTGPIVIVTDMPTGLDCKRIMRWFYNGVVKRVGLDHVGEWTLKTPWPVTEDRIEYILRNTSRGHTVRSEISALEAVSYEGNGMWLTYRALARILRALG